LLPATATLSKSAIALPHVLFGGVSETVML
jgi:hypothetical protein